MSEVTIREAAASDAENMLKYIEIVAGETDNLSFGPGEFDLSLEQERAFLDAAAAAGNQLCLLALSNGEIVGALHIATGKRPRTRHVGEFGISVRQGFWGNGVGRELLQRMIAWAQETGFVRKINLRVRTDNSRAIRIYERAGFEREGTLTRDMCVDGAFHDFHCMGLKID